MSGKSISKNAEVSITRSDKRKDLWPAIKGDANEHLKVWVLPREGRLGIALDILEHPSNRGVADTYKNRRSSKSLICDGDKLKINKEGKGESVYERGTRWGGRSFVAHDSKKLNIGISVNSCKKLNQKQIECSLKVVTKRQI